MRHDQRGHQRQRQGCGKQECLRRRHIAHRRNQRPGNAHKDRRPPDQPDQAVAVIGRLSRHIVVGDMQPQQLADAKHQQPGQRHQRKDHHGVGGFDIGNRHHQHLPHQVQRQHHPQHRSMKPPFGAAFWRQLQQRVRRGAFGKHQQPEPAAGKQAEPRHRQHIQHRIASQPDQPGQPQCRHQQKHPCQRQQHLTQRHHHAIGGAPLGRGAGQPQGQPLHPAAAAVQQHQCHRQIGQNRGQIGTQHDLWHSGAPGVANLGRQPHQRLAEGCDPGGPVGGVDRGGPDRHQRIGLTVAGDAVDIGNQPVGIAVRLFRLQPRCLQQTKRPRQFGAAFGDLWRLRLGPGHRTQRVDLAPDRVDLCGVFGLAFQECRPPFGDLHPQLVQRQIGGAPVADGRRRPLCHQRPFFEIGGCGLR